MAVRLACWITIAALGWMLSGCAVTRSVQATVSGWFGATDASSAERPQASYARAAGVALHRSPDASSEVVGKLGLHEGVLRFQLEDGFAYVKSEQSGRSGWVRERDLIERLPAAKKPSDASEPPATEEPPAESPEKSIFDPY